MIPRWIERPGILCLLLIGAWLRIWHLSSLPAGFSDSEINSIAITEHIRQGRVQVFFENTQHSGQESFYQTANMLLTSLVGDGLIGFRLLGLWSNLAALALFYRRSEERRV